METKEDIEKALIESLEFSIREGGCPEMVFIPDVGWVNLKDGIADHPELLKAWFDEHYPNGT